MVLQSIRDRLHGIIAIFIFGILIIPFAFVGVNSYFTSGSVNAVALVNDEEITSNEFNQAFQNYRRRMQAQMGPSFDPELIDQPIIRRQFLDQMINEELLAQVSVDAGLAISKEQLALEIRSMTVFDVDGEFSPDVYQQWLASQGLTATMFEQNVREGILMEQFPNSVANSAIATRHELESYARLMDQERVYSAVTVPAMVNEEAVIDEEAVTAWYENNQGDYLSEEQVLIEYIELSADAIGGEVEITEEDLRARFEQQQQRFISPEARLASHILIEVDPEAPEVDIESARSQAEELAERARAGEDFAQLATEYSQDLGSADMGGDLGWIEPDYMVKAFEDGLYALTLENPISDPVQTRFGWHVIQLREIRPSQGMTFAEARDILMEEYQAEQDERRFIEQADRLIDIIYEDPTTLQAAALELGLEVQEAGPFGRGGAEEGIAANPEVVSTAFSDLVLGQRSVSDPVNLDTNHIVLLLVKQHMPEALIPLEDVREQVVQAVRDQRARDAARARAEELLARLQAGEALEGLAVEAELEPVLSATARRQSPNMDSGLRNELFRMAIPEEGAMTTGVVEVADGYAVVQLESVIEGELAADDDVRKQLYQRRVQAATASDEMMAFIRMLREQSTIEVFEDRLQ